MKLSPAVYATVLATFFWPGMSSKIGSAQTPLTTTQPERVILDTDIGDDIDDAFALALLVNHPGVQLLGVTTAWGDTGLRARLASRFLSITGNGNIPVYAGLPTTSRAPFTQSRWAQRWPETRPVSNQAIPFLLDTIRRYPGQITLLAIAPLSNLGALIDKDPTTFHRLKQVVLMGGSIDRGYGNLESEPARGPDPEYNIQMDPGAARKLLASGVPVFMLPLDSTQLKLDQDRRTRLFSQDTPLTETLSVLYYQWRSATQNATPTLYDAMAAAYLLQPSLCPMTPMRIQVDDAGYTRPVPGKPNTNVCLRSNSAQFFSFFMRNILQNPGPARAAPAPCAGNP